MRPSSAAVFVAASLAVMSVAAPGGAQSIRDRVRQHVSEGLDGQRAEPSKKKAKKRRPRAADDASGPDTAPKRGDRDGPAARPAPARPSAAAEPSPPPANTASDAAARTPAPHVPPEKRLPLRVFGDDFELDAKVGAGIRGWYPEQYPLVRVDHASYATWSVDLRATILGFLRLHRGYYESNGLRGPRTRGAVIARDVGRLVPKAAWLLGTLGVPLSRRWETLVSYETRSFVTRARPSAPVAVVARKTSPDADLSTLPRAAGALEFVSGFETLVVGVRYFPERGNAGLVGDAASSLPPMYLGVGLSQYSKPYQVQVGDDPLDELLFNGRFRGAGLAYGLATARAIDRPYVSLDTQLGLGEVSLLDELTLNQLLPEDWLIGYLQGNVTFGYILPLLRARPTPLLTGELSAGGATFFYFQLRDGGDEAAPTLPLNWDIFWAVHVSLTLPL